MNSLVKDHTLALLAKGTREDSRKTDEYRDISIEYGISPKSAEGSARVKIGDTEVVAGVKVEMGRPFPDKPDQGSIMVNCELLPMSNPKFESGPPSIGSIELSRVTDRVLRESGVLDFKKLCIEKGEKVWNLLIDIYPINADGNLFDAAYLCALAALKDMKFPKVVDEKIQYGTPSKQGANLVKDRLPLSCTVWKIGDHLVIDPTYTEEQCAEGRLTVGILPNKALCALQKGQEKALTSDEIDQMVDLAIKKSLELRKVFEK
jgi:exosome complex component RRP42